MTFRTALSGLLALKRVRSFFKDALRGVETRKLSGWLQRLVLARSKEPRERLTRAFDGFLTQRAVDALLPWVMEHLDLLDDLTDQWVEHAKKTKGQLDDAFFETLDAAVDRLIDTIRDEPVATETADAAPA